MRSRPITSILAPLTSALACGGGDSTNPSPPPAPAVTPAGTPTGPVITQMIGPAGGTLMSDDTRLRVVVPAGALGSDVSVGVQRIAAESPGATA